MEIKIRKLEIKDFPAANEIACMAFNTTSNRQEDLSRYLALEPEGWLLAELSGEPVGMVGAIDYGPFASIGMMVVRPNVQRLGIGRRLMESILGWLDQRGCPAAILEATPSGKPLYESLGFKPAGLTLRYQSTGISVKQPADFSVRGINPGDIPNLNEFDRKIFRADRSRVLSSLYKDYSERSFISMNSDEKISGYLICTRKQIGPWVALEIQSARILMDAALNLTFEELPYVIIPAENQAGVEITGEYGFVYNRSCTHMVRGFTSSPVRRGFIYGEASLALG